MRRWTALAGTSLAMVIAPSLMAQQMEGEQEVEEPQADTLAIGDEAPALDIEHWVKGDQVTEFEEDKVYVVEFWATWCGPCRVSMPHISELQEKYKDYDVQFIGVSDEDLATVEGFIKTEEWDAKTEYTIAADPDNSTHRAYMEAAGQGGIPTAFVVGREGHIEWIGHPMEIDPVIEKIAHNTWDREAYAREAEAKEAAMGQLMEAYALLQNEETAAQGYTILRENIEPFWSDAQMLNAISWSVLTDEAIVTRDLDLALEWATQAGELTENKDASILDTVARAHHAKGDLKSAIKFQTLAVENAEEEMKADLQATLDEYEKEAADGGN